MFYPFAMAGAWLALGLPLAAQHVPVDAAAHPYVLAVGEATASAKPDQAKINVGVTTQGANASAVATQNSTQVNAVLGELQRALGVAGEIKTTNYSVTPNYNYPKSGGQPVISGYTASNVVEVTVNDLRVVGKVIDAATQSGANNIQRLQFILKNEQPLRAQALKDAAAQARANAEAMAAGLGVKIARVLSVEESSPATITPMVRQMAMSAMTAAAPPTPVESGSIELHVTVTLRLELAQ